ncbi:MAG: ATP-dependent DNA helicase RecG [Candidatus Handelsmanbacteria bacterium RIFCSPLOWO2_12_FULL_64_10]|uniref:ATP-dependent DNA helicase RecG n=1 Tax=Handelsmanbacteria sp. (strain RIFCSPLOWO2_12_FULL_64_10) TaxID=1817868 RepID=A0A1F6CTE9_HANXR|nr:MAG: ATP-dependent DNA helicase RecG [Candidatus Handelsmanbacteria bacterium RIFCSPLOWO2_12_FULL_64_10]
MLKTELMELIRNGENSGVELKRDDVHPDSLAKEIAALLNLEGGYILLGVEDNGTVTGLTRDPRQAEEWVMNVCQNNIQPAIIPYWETIPWEDSKVVGVITLPADSPDKPYKAKHGPAWSTFVRVGSTSRDATREQEARLYQASGLVRYDVKPVPGTTLNDLDRRRLENYFRDIRQQDCPPTEDEEGWRRLLLNTDLMVEDRGRAISTAGAILLFGRKPNRLLPQAGITATAYPGTEKEYAARERPTLRGPIVPLKSTTGEVLETGLVEQAMDFVRRNTAVEARIDEGGRRQDRWKDYPLEAIREAVVNAVAHRDYTIAVTDIELSLYSDRLEVISPGRLPNTVTVEKMKYGYRATRNELIKEILRDYRHIEATGLGVPRKIIRGMREHNGTDPDLIEAEDRFTVRLWKGRREP